MLTYVKTKDLFSLTKPALRGLIVPVLLFAGCTGSQHNHTMPATEVDQTIEKKDLSDLEELYWQRLDESRMSFVQADVDFMSGMIVHHAQALIMSRLAPENDASGQLQTLAARIINAQQDEIATMQKWLRDRAQPVPVIHIDGLILSAEIEEPEQPAAHHAMTHDTMGDHHHMEQPGEEEEDGSQEMEQPTTAHTMVHEHNRMDMDNHHGMGHHSMAHHHDMPGMLSQAQLEELAGLKGAEFDRTFLTYMIEHHEGAVYMVNELFAADGAANDEESYRLAVDIYAEQITEIEMMKLMLRQRGVQP